MRITNTDEIEDLLGDLSFPASKERIVEHARRHGASEEAEKALRALPLGEYANVKEVLRSVPVDPAPDRSESERVYQQRHHRKSGLAEHMRTAARPPVEEELRSDTEDGPR